jgi:uncharacterized protein YukE
MNKAQQKRLSAVVSSLEAAEAEIEAVKDELQEDFDNRSERWQEGEKGEALQAAIDALNEEQEKVNEASTGINTVIGEQ